MIIILIKFALNQIPSKSVNLFYNTRLIYSSIPCIVNLNRKQEAVIQTAMGSAGLQENF